LFNCTSWTFEQQPFSLTGPLNARTFRIALGAGPGASPVYTGWLLFSQTARGRYPLVGG